MINPGKNHLPGMLLFLDFSKIAVGFGVPDKLEFAVLLVFPRRGRVSRPAGGETPPLHCLTGLPFIPLNPNLSQKTVPL